MVIVVQVSSPQATHTNICLGKKETFSGSSVIDFSRYNIVCPQGKRSENDIVNGDVSQINLQFTDQALYIIRQS